MRIVLLTAKLIDGQRDAVGERATVDVETGQRLIARDEAFEDKDLTLERALERAESMLEQDAKKYGGKSNA